MPPTKLWNSASAWPWPSTKSWCRQCWLRQIVQSPRTPNTRRLTRGWASRDNRACKCASSRYNPIILSSTYWQHHKIWQAIVLSSPWRQELQMSHHRTAGSRWDKQCWPPTTCSSRWRMKLRWCPNSTARATSYSETSSLAFDRPVDNVIRRLKFDCTDR